ncbi:MAG: NAD(P)/FAD-dependent oxidoreductase [Moraxellaceae bacterium]|nr:NAD(P)/FAD-dependent oxidoreductase [Moraxellaceae bacterium]
MATEHVDVLIVGAGLSGIGAAYHLKTKCPGKTYAILEGRKAIGGTWDLFRYPGIRSDSDMYTLGYNFKPWTDPKIIADGHTIREYIQETARENGIDKHIRFGTKVLSAAWSTADATWSVQTQNDAGETRTFTCNFLISCTGYYNYEAGYTPEFPGIKKYKGTVIHPQKWPEDLDYAGKKVVVIGSGATAVTLVPAMTDKAAHVTMLQRSPTYVATVPQVDVISQAMRRFLPEMAVYRMGRTRNVGIQMGVFNLAKSKPKVVRRLLLAQVRAQVGKDFDMKHFTPNYNPWDERLCAVPNGDLFKVLRKGKASVVTDHIDTFTAKGIKLKSGEELEADIIITATGLDLQMMGGMQLSVDGQPFDITQTMNYKGVMFRDLPNLAMMFGYTNASWTLKSDISTEYVCRLIKHMDKNGLRQCTPRNNDPTVVEESFVDMRSGYIQRAAGKMPKQGNKAPWKVYMNYALDLATLRYKAVEDGNMVFSNPVPASGRAKTALAS